jgi:hypothetical protein
MTSLFQDWSHNDLRNYVLLRLSEAGWLCWPNDTGFGWTYDKKRPLRAGLKGSSDIIALRPPKGRGCMVEIKIGNDDLRESQIHFRESVLRVGGDHFIVRDSTHKEDIENILKS